MIYLSVTAIAHPLRLQVQPPVHDEARRMNFNEWVFHQKYGTNLTKRKAVFTIFIDFPLLPLVCKDATAPAFILFLIILKKLIPFCVNCVCPPALARNCHFEGIYSSDFHPSCKINPDILWHGKTLFFSRGALTVWRSLLLKLGQWLFDAPRCSESCILRTLKLLQREQNHSNAEDARFFGEATGSEPDDDRIAWCYVMQTANGKPKPKNQFSTCWYWYIWYCVYHVFFSAMS